jgi:hypothetical protein
MKKTQISKIINKQGEIIKNSNEIKRIIAGYFERTYIPINWTILKKLTNFWIPMTIQN